MVKPIKKAKPIKPSNTNDLLSFIRQTKEDETLENKERAQVAAKTRSINKNNPSKLSEFSQWKSKQIGSWHANDFIGYYLHVYSEVIGEEDLDFKGKTSREKYGKEKGYLNRCLEKLFNDDQREFRNYIKWIIKWWMTEDSFVDGYPSFWSVFTSEKATFVKLFNAQKSNLVKTKKVIKTRKQADDSFASRDAWDQYFEEGGK